MQRFQYKDLGVVILAAGKGTRMKSSLPKVLHKVGSQTMISHVINVVQKISQDNIYVVIGHESLKVKKEVNKFFKVNFVTQKKLLGTADAIKAAIPAIKPKIKDVLVLCGDVPLIQPQTLKDLINKHRQKNASLSLLVVRIDDPKGYGRIIFDEKGNLVDIKEELDATEGERKINTINTGIYCFDKKFLEFSINFIKPDNKKKEYYLTDIVKIAKEQNQKVIYSLTQNPFQVLGINTQAELVSAEKLLQNVGYV